MFGLIRKSNVKNKINKEVRKAENRVEKELTREYNFEVIKLKEQFQKREIELLNEIRKRNREFRVVEGVSERALKISEKAETLQENFFNLSMSSVLDMLTKIFAEGIHLKKDKKKMQRKVVYLKRNVS